MASIKLVGDSQRQYALDCLCNAPQGAVVTIKPASRTLDQNAKMWAMLHDIASHKPQGRVWTPDMWKAAFMHHLGHQILFCECLDGTGQFPVGFRSSHMTVAQMSDLIEVIYQYGDRHGVIWHQATRTGVMGNDPRAQKQPA